MPELIFATIFFIFITGMLLSDVDSRTWRWGEAYPPYSAAAEALRMLREYEESDEMRLMRTAIISAQVQAFGRLGPSTNEMASALKNLCGAGMSFNEAVTTFKKNTERDFKCESVPYLVDILDQDYPVVTIKKGCSIGVSTSFMPESKDQ